MKIFLFIAMVLSGCLYGQDGLVTSVNKGILSQTVYSIYGDKAGRLWFCTDKGACLYNGKEFVNYNVNNGMPENEVFGAFEDAQKRVWLKTLKGELFYIYNNKVITKKNNAVLQKLNALIVNHSDDLIHTIFQADGDTVYFMTKRKCVYKLSKNGGFSLSRLPKKNNCYHLLSIHKSLYFIWEKGIYEFYSGKLITPFELHAIYAHMQFIEFKNNTYFIKDNTIYRIKGLSIEPYYTVPVKDVISYFNFIDDTTLLLCSQKKSYLKKQNTLLEVNQLDGVNVNYLHVDIEKNCWISSSNKGLFLLNNLAYHFYNDSILAGKNITEIIHAPNGFFIGDNEGRVFNLDTKTKVVSNLNIRKEKNTLIGTTKVRSMALKDSLELWIGYNDEIVKYNIRTHQTKSILNNSIKSIQPDAYGTIWITSLGAILSDKEIENPHQHSRYFDSASFKYQRIYGFCHDSISNCYYVSHDNLLITYKDSILKKQALNGRILKIKTKNHRFFWIQTQANDLVLYDRHSFTNITISPAFNTNLSCNDFYLLNDTTAWVAGNEGYYKIEIDSKSKKIRKQNFYELITATGPTSIAKIIYNNGSVYLGTETGLISIREQALQTGRYDVPILITGVTINEQPTDIRYNYHLASHQTNVSIDYVGLYYQAFGKINYRYKFIGTDTSWHYTKATHLEFPDLVPGSYTLIINPSDHHGNWSRYKTTTTFFIATPWYKTTLFRACAFLLLSTTTLLLIRYYIRQKQIKNKFALNLKLTLLDAKEKQLEAEKKMFMAQVNPHFIFNSLNSIQKFILHSKPEEAYTYIEKFSRLIRNILVNSKNDLIEISEDIENLKTYLELEQLRFKNKLEVELIIDQDPIEEGKIPAMLVQPYVENAIWHGLMPKQEKGKLTISYHITPHHVEVQIQDNGIGRVASLQNHEHVRGTSSGMMLTEERLKLYSQKIKKEYSIMIHDLYEQGLPDGTLIALKIPIN